ncbi:hypothetical protein SAMN05216480_101435 [Pustulibacterium marinum]|uniref:SdiA-regulated n=1 Tax=Pustulibacterium marinum TaxID=1224947 RepID=A0A1I7EYN9_9FLAO|nr:hypothetical protein [Pustulibacterium marinum]SFU29053.1 hypothetical protein SAMN05216480_101435 [Pustulibacterium marinum]
MKFLQTLLFSVLLTTSCSNYGQLKPVAELPKDLKENSGMVMLSKKSIWFIEDSGNENEIYQVDFDGKIMNTIEIENAKNEDWEELAKDDDDNVFIGDFGNNKNERKDLTIYIIPNPEKLDDDKVKAEKITFNYPEQEHFPSKKKNRIYDSEAFFYLDGNLYIFTKDRSEPYSGVCSLYKIPAKPGDYEAKLIDTFHFGDTFDTGSITSATISTNHKKVVLLTHEMIYILEDFEDDDFFTGKLTKLNMEHVSQKESVCFKNKNTLLISDEAEKHSKPMLYEMKLN